MTLAEKIKDAIAAGITFRQIEDRSGITYSTIYAISFGHVKDTGHEKAIKIQEAILSLIADRQEAAAGLRRP